MATYQEIIAKIETRLKNADRNAERKVPHTFLFKITKDGKMEKSCFLDLKNLVMKLDSTDTAECTVTLDHQLLVDVSTKKIKLQEALQKGLVKIEGKVELAAALEQFITQ